MSVQMRPVAESTWFLLLQNWQMPDDMGTIEEYVDRVRDRDSFRNSTTPSQDIINHWCAPSLFAQKRPGSPLNFCRTPQSRAVGCAATGLETGLNALIDKGSPWSTP